MPGQYSSVTIVGPEASRDLALPTAVPVAELLPPLMDRGVIKHSGQDAATRWELATISGHRLDPSSTLDDQEIRDGDVLHLHDVTDDVIPDPVEDVRDSIEDHVDEAGRRWKAHEGKIYAITVAAVVVAAAAFLPGRNLAILLTGMLICLLSVVITWWSAPVNTRLAQLGMAAGALWAWRAVYLASGYIVDVPGVPGEIIRHGYGIWAAVLLILVILVGTPLALSYLTGLGIAALLFTPVSVALLLQVDIIKQTALAALAIVFAVGVLPRAFMAVCGLLGLDQRVQIGERTEHSELDILLSRVDSMLVGASIALSALGALTSVTLILFGGSIWSFLLGALVGAALLTRSRVFDQARHVGPFRVGGTVCLGAAGVAWLATSATMWMWLPAVLVVAALIYVAGALVPRSTVINARAGRVLRVAEILLVAAMMALAAQVLGLYELVSW